VVVAERRRNRMVCLPNIVRFELTVTHAVTVSKLLILLIIIIVLVHLNISDYM